MNLHLVQRECGACTACCVHLGIDNVPGYGPAGKEAGQSCKHLGFGCGIQETKPVSCKAFLCGWRHFLALEDDMRPDRTGILIAPLTVNLSREGRVAPMMKRGIAWSIQIFRHDVDPNLAFQLGQFLLARYPEIVRTVAIVSTHIGYGDNVPAVVMGDISLIEGGTTSAKASLEDAAKLIMEPLL